MKRLVHSKAKRLLPLFLFLWTELSAQTVSFTLNKEPVEKAFPLIEAQVKYRFMYTAEILEDMPLVSLRVEKASLPAALNLLFKNLPLSYSIEDSYILLRQKQAVSLWPGELSGRILDENGGPLGGATIAVKGSFKAVSSNSSGAFRLPGVEPGDILLVSSIGYRPIEVPLNGRSWIEIQLSISVSILDEAVVKGYYSTSRRLDVGTVAKITREQISTQPATNPLTLIQGRAAGVFVSSASGLPGAEVKIQIRGRNSIAAGNSPLYIVDGVPFPSTALNERSELQAANGPLSPFNSLNPSDIETIEILKDAEATSLYGSRGSNGVVLVTTKKGRAGRVTVDLSFYKGWATVPRRLPLLSVQEYRAVRKAAFLYDGVVPTSQKAPDLLLWDSTASTDWQSFLTGRTAPLSDATLSFSGGSAGTRFLFSTHYRKEGIVYPGDFGYRRGGAHLTVSNSAFEERLSTQFSVSYTTEENRITQIALSSLITLPPNYPLFDASGVYYWGGYPNALALLGQKASAKTDNILANGSFRYRLLQGLFVKSAFGFNYIKTDQVSLFPKASQDPAQSPVGYSRFGNNSVRSLIVEPQLDYACDLGTPSLRLKVLAGGTWQQNERKSLYIEGQDYSSDILLPSLGAAGSIRSRSNSTINYKYTSLFGHLSLEWKRKYLLAGSFRRDGSSRFGDGQRFGNFAAAALGWIFSEEKTVVLLGRKLGLSYGKLKGSYGISGNDQIPDYGYLEVYAPSSFLYQGPFLTPSRIANPFYSWEKNKKGELGVELGFLSDRIFLSANWYFNRSGNQLVSYPLASQSGFSGYQANLNALVENRGWELEGSVTILKSEKIKWKTGFNLTLPKNKLLEFPGLASSSYSNTYRIGQPLSIVQGYRFTGIDPQTGVARYGDIDGDGMIRFPNDYVVMGNAAPALHGGFSSTLDYGSIKLDLLLQFVKQQATGLFDVPGVMINLTDKALDYWRKPGDFTNTPVPSATAGTAVQNANQNLPSSTALWQDASYLLLKTVSLSWTPRTLLKKKPLLKSRLYIQGQNLFTLTPYQGLDPETGPITLPPLRLIIAGIQITF